MAASAEQLKKVKEINIDDSDIPSGEYTEVGHKIHQVFEIEMSGIAPEYQAQVLEDGNGKRCTVREEHKGTLRVSAQKRVCSYISSYRKQDIASTTVLA